MAIVYGGDYNPEQWDEATWREDARRVCQSWGVSTGRPWLSTNGSGSTNCGTRCSS
jgi:hypothetical protein